MYLTSPYRTYVPTHLTYLPIPTLRQSYLDQLHEAHKVTVSSLCPLSRWAADRKSNKHSQFSSASYRNPLLILFHITSPPLVRLLLPCRTFGARYWAPTVCLGLLYATIRLSSFAIASEDEWNHGTKQPSSQWWTRLQFRPHNRRSVRAGNNFHRNGQFMEAIVVACVALLTPLYCIAGLAYRIHLVNRV